MAECARLSTMKRGAIVVNTGRGPSVGDEALIAALKSGHIRAAGLDVFDGEPNVNPGYLTLQNVTLLPHLGSATIETHDAMGHCALDDLDAVLLKGTDPVHRGDLKPLWYPGPLLWPALELTRWPIWPKQWGRDDGCE
jgi:lactate dehydrogenase-like 2-hydroxyacid dehydrogenase